VINIAFAATESHIGFNQANQSLDQQLLEKLFVGRRVLGHLVVQFDLRVVLQTLNKLVDTTHLVNALLVLQGGLLNLEVDLCICKVLLVLFNKTLLLSFDSFLFSDSEIIVGLALDLSNTLITVCLNELDHTVKDLSGSLHFL